MTPDRPPTLSPGVSPQELAARSEDFTDGTQDQGQGSTRRRRKAPWVIGLTVLVVAVGVSLAIADPFAATRSGNAGLANAHSTGLYTVVRQGLSSQTQVPGTLGYAGTYTVVNQAQGTVTSLPSIGQVVTQGYVLYEVGLNPVILLYGQTPANRTLSEGMTGPDVEELNADLVALGYVTGTELSPTSDVFTPATTTGVKKLQAAVGVAQTGTLTLGEAVFEPTAVRVTSVSATLGGPAQAGQSVLAATSTTRQVSISLDADQQSEVAVGDHVTISLPNNQTTTGIVTSVGTVATTPASGGTPTVTVLANPTDPAATGAWDQAPVNVTITTGTVSNAVVVPVDALLAEPGGGYAVEVVDPTGIHHLVTVALGLFDDAQGTVQITSGLTVGQHVVVPAL